MKMMLGNYVLAELSRDFGHEENVKGLYYRDTDTIFFKQLPEANLENVQAALLKFLPEACREHVVWIGKL